MRRKLETVREQLTAVQRELDLQRARTEAAEVRTAEAEGLHEQRRPAGMREELAAVFRETEEAVARIVEGSRRDAEADRASIVSEVADLTAWRNRVEPHVQPLREAVADARREAELVSALIAEALEPITAALTVLETRLGAVLEVAGDAWDDDVVVDTSHEDRTPSPLRGVERAHPPPEGSTRLGGYLRARG
jgi:hypothetical protein